MKHRIVPSCQIRALTDILEFVFGDYIGFFVELGAYDGVHYSNTYGLSMDGWGGMLIEPDEELFKKCRNVHQFNPRIFVEHALVGTGGEVDFYPGGEYSTSSTDFMKSIPQEWGAKFSPPVKMRMVTLDSLLDKHHIEHVDLLSVDTEGTELDVLNSFSIQKYRPRMVIVEAHEQHPRIELQANAPAINKYFDAAGYQKIYTDELNNIYFKDWRIK